MRIEIQTDAAWEPVTTPEAKLHTHVDLDDEDDLMGAFIESARERAEVECGRTIPQKTLVLILPCFPGSFGAVRLCLPPFQSVTSVEYYDENNELQTLAASRYVAAVGADSGTLTPAGCEAWPINTYDRPDAVRVTYVAGYASAADVPEAIKTWIKIQVTTMHDTRSAEASGGTSPNKYVDRLLDKYRLEDS